MRGDPAFTTIVENPDLVNARRKIGESRGILRRMNDRSGDDFVLYARSREHIRSHRPVVVAGDVGTWDGEGEEYEFVIDGDILGLRIRVGTQSLRGNNTVITMRESAQEVCR